MFVLSFFKYMFTGIDQMQICSLTNKDNIEFSAGWVDGGLLLATASEATSARLNKRTVVTLLFKSPS
jgi:hypothetical protein